MTTCLFHRKRAIGGAAALLVSGLVVGPAAASPGKSGHAPCRPPSLSQPFAEAGDYNSYMLAPGQTSNGFDGLGWRLTDGARIVTAQLANGQVGSVLEMPSGARAVSPTFCVRSDFPVARVVIDDLTGDGAVQVAVSNNRYRGGLAYAGAVDPTEPVGWSLSAPFDVNPSAAPGQQHIRFTFVATGSNSEFRLYDFYVDPRMKK